VGQVAKVSTNGAWYVARADGLAPITALQAQLLMAETQQSAPKTLTDPGAVPGNLAPLPAAGLPATVPTPVTPDPQGTQVCAVLVDGAQGSVTVTTSGATTQQLTGASPEPVDVTGMPLADTVMIPSGKGALVRSVPGPGVTTGSLFLITDLGVKYLIPAGSSVLSDLGLAKATISALPQPIAALIPTGPALDEASALVQQAADPSNATPTGVTP
jgi:hypothetical protein